MKLCDLVRVEMSKQTSKDFLRPILMMRGLSVNCKALHTYSKYKYETFRDIYTAKVIEQRLLRGDKGFLWLLSLRYVCYAHALAYYAHVWKHVDLDIFKDFMEKLNESER